MANHPTRRTSARLSAEGTQQALWEGTSQSQPTSSSGKQGNDQQDDVFGALSGDAAGDESRKRQKTDQAAPRRKGKTAASFKPLPISNVTETPSKQKARPPPPPPSDRKIARRIPNTHLSTDIEPRMDKTPARLVVSNGNSSRPTTTTTTALEGDGSLQAELGDEQRRWDHMVEQSTSAGGSRTPARGNHQLDFLSFAASQAPSFSAPRPISPPRTVSKAATDFQTPRASRRIVKDVALDAVVPIALSDTPMIRKNQEMRKEASRRSSLGNRGARLSETTSRGDISAPHASVPSKTLYKHLGNDLPQTLRARHLVLWCLKRAMDADHATSQDIQKRDERRRLKGKGKAKELPTTRQGDELVAAIMNDVLRGAAKGEIEDSIYAQPSGDTSAAASQKAPDSGLRPHPRNVSNRQVQERFKQNISRDKAEEQEWISIVARVNAHRTRVIEEQQEMKRRQADPSMIDPAEAMPHFTGAADGAGTDMLNSWLAIAQDVLNSGEKVEPLELDDMEYHIDVINQAAHAALQYSTTAAKFLDGIFASLAQDIRNRDQTGARSTLVDSSAADQEGGAISVAGFMTGLQRDAPVENKKSALDILRSLSADDPGTRET